VVHHTELLTDNKIKHLIKHLKKLMKLFRLTRNFQAVVMELLCRTADVQEQD